MQRATVVALSRPSVVRIHGSMMLRYWVPGWSFWVRGCG